RVEDEAVGNAIDAHVAYGLGKDIDFILGRIVDELLKMSLDLSDLLHDRLLVGAVRFLTRSGAQVEGAGHHDLFRKPGEGLLAHAVSGEGAGWRRFAFHARQRDLRIIAGKSFRT